MDAKPQRPVRAIRIPRDENAPPVPAHTTKSLHSRTKSTPALSTVPTAPNMAKPLGKRAAFGDLSNTTALKSKDESKTQDKAAPGIARPAQRPAAKSLSSAAPPLEVGIKPLPAQGNTRKPLARRNTVFRDSALPPVAESVSKEDTKVEDHREDVNTKPVTEGSVNDAKASDLVKEEASSDEETPEAGPATGRGTNKSEREIDEHLDKLNDMQLVTASAATGILADLPGAAYDIPSELCERVDLTENVEESWDEYDDEDDDYITSLNLPRMDNTTGPATVVLFPKYDRDAKQELAIAKKVVDIKGTTRDEYEDEQFDTSMVAEYGTEIFQYMRELERRLMPNPHYMDNQAEIQWSMRSVLMDWLVQVHLRFGLLPETLYLCVNYIDRFLSCKVVSLGKLQLVGATAIFIAAKYEEINCPSVREVVYMVDNGYTEDEILKAERYMLTMLQFELGFPGPMSFLRRISKADDYDVETRTLAKYFLEVTIMDERFVGSPPSFLAAAAHCISRLMLKKGTWTAEHVYYSNYTYTQLYPVMSLILECCAHPQRHHAAIYEKYTDKRFKRASYFAEAEIRKGFTLPNIFRDNLLARYHKDGTPILRLY